MDWEIRDVDYSIVVYTMLARCWQWDAFCLDSGCSWRVPDGFWPKMVGVRGRESWPGGWLGDRVCRVCISSSDLIGDHVVDGAPNLRRLSERGSSIVPFTILVPEEARMSAGAEFFNWLKPISSSAEYIYSY